MNDFFEQWPKEARWFIIGGMADTNEAIQVKQRFSEVQCLGIEPNPLYVNQQRTMGFPGTLLEGALWDEPGMGILKRPSNATWASASLCRPDVAPDMNGEWELEDQLVVPLQTLDAIHVEHGPLDDIVLWLDVEYAEIKSLLGAVNLFREGRVLMVNVETYAHANLSYIVDFLFRHGLTLRKVWNTKGPMDAQDYIFKMEEDR